MYYYIFSCQFVEQLSISGLSVFIHSLTSNNLYDWGLGQASLNNLLSSNAATCQQVTIDASLIEEC